MGCLDNDAFSLISLDPLAYLLSHEFGCVPCWRILLHVGTARVADVVTPVDEWRVHEEGNVEHRSQGLGKHHAEKVTSDRIALLGFWLRHGTAATALQFATVLDSDRPVQSLNGCYLPRCVLRRNGPYSRKEERTFTNGVDVWGWVGKLI